MKTRRWISQISRYTVLTLGVMYFLGILNATAFVLHMLGVPLVLLINVALMPFWMSMIIAPLLSMFGFMITEELAQQFDIPKVIYIGVFAMLSLMLVSFWFYIFLMFMGSLPSQI